MIRDFCAFSALFIFLYGMGLVALAIDKPNHLNHTAIVAGN